MRSIYVSRIGCCGVLLSVAVLVASSLFLAAPANAFPSRAWWYGELSVAKAQQVSKGAGVTVAVLDTGVKASLGDLRGRVLPGLSFVGGNPRDDIPSSANRYFGHGTQMAAYIAGTGKGAGLVGIAPSAKILPVRDADPSHVDEAATSRGIMWAVDHGAKVINVSTAGQSACPADQQKAVDYAVGHDVIVVAGTGNEGGTAIGFPANCVGAIAVGGLAYSSAFKPWSASTGGPELDFVAPAEHLLGLLLDDTISNPDGSGTSAATAFVSGTFALLRSKFPSESARHIVTRALWNVHNGLGEKFFAKRIDDRLGYGEILPNFALTVNPPANAANPIYDDIEKHLKATGTTSPAPSTAASGPAAAPSKDTAGGGAGGFSPVVVLLLALAALAVVIGIVLAVARGRRSRRPGPFGPPPSGPYRQY